MHADKKMAHFYTIEIRFVMALSSGSNTSRPINS